MLPPHSVAEPNASEDLSGAGQPLGWLLGQAPYQQVALSAAELLGLVPEPALTGAESLQNAFPPLALIDMSVPGAEELLTHWTQAGASLSTLVLAITLQEQQESAALRAGAAATVRWPFALETLVERLRWLLRLKHKLETERAQAQQQALQSRVQRIGRITAAFAHEVASPLSVALLNAKFLSDTLTLPRAPSGPVLAELQEVTVDIYEAIEHVQKVVQEVRALYRSGPSALGPVRLSTVVRDAVSAVSNPQQVPITVQEDAPELWGQAVTDLLQRVVEQLLSNALHAVRQQPEPKVLVRIYQVGKEARISVRDNGPGVAPELEPRIWEPFFSTHKTDALGMGLALCEELVTRMGGTMSLSSTEDGACFRVRLRCA